MAKKRKMKKSAVVIITICLFFPIYIMTYMYLVNRAEKGENITKQQIQQQDNEEQTESLLSQLRTKEKLYIKEENIEGVKVEEEHRKELNFIYDKIAEVRKPDNYVSIYEGYSDDGLKFSTDLNYFRVYNVNEEVYYKVPVANKEELEHIIKECIYTSFDLVKEYKAWDKVTVTYEDKTKKISGFKYDELAYKMGSKRMVGKIQPEKSKERSEYNFIIDIQAKNYDVKVETMGDDYVKITSKDQESYYEVNDLLYYYLKDEVIKIKDK